MENKERLTKAELVNGFPVCYPKNDSGVGEIVVKGHPYREIVEKLKYYEDLEEKLNKQFSGCIEIKEFVDSIIEYDKQLERNEELAEAMMITNDSVRKYCEWKNLDEQGKMLKNPQELSDSILGRMKEFADEYSGYSESTIDYFGAKAEAMEMAMKIVEDAFSDFIG